MKGRIVAGVVAIWLFSVNAFAQPAIFKDSFTIKTGINNFWWAGVVADGYKMPLSNKYDVNFTDENFGNQVQPLLLSANGEVIWSEQPFGIHYTADSLQVQGKSAIFQFYKAGETLKDAYAYASKNYFPPSGKTPDTLLFTSPQYNTWIELVYNQNETDVLAYARNILANGLPPGVLMIDDTWQEDYGNWSFHPGKFLHPRQMIDSLHRMGFKVMVWVCPFVSPDSYVYRDLSEKKYLVTDDAGQPTIIKWWNGASAALDLTNPGAASWIKAELEKLRDDYGVDGFKLDAGDFEFYVNTHAYNPSAKPADQSAAWGKIGLDYPLNEYRAIWKMGGQPLAQRLHDKNSGFADLQLLIPNMLAEGLMGYYFSCPDMIGGGDFASFKNNAQLDQEAIVRSAQCHALMPMMQFSVAPWRVLDDQHLTAVKKAVAIRQKFKDYILSLAIHASITGEPIMRPMEYNYPHQGYAKIINQFLLGDQLLVAPVLEKGAVSRTVEIPAGKWKSFDGKIFKGPQSVEVKVTIDDLPFFEKIK